MSEGGCLINPFSAGTDFRRPNWTVLDAIPANTKRSANVGTMLGQPDVESDDMAYAKIFQRSVLMTWEWSLSATVDVVH